MATMFEGDRKAVESRLKRMKAKRFFEKLLDDDWVKKIVLESGSILTLKMTTSVKSPLTLLVIDLVKLEDRVVFRILTSTSRQSFAPHRWGYIYDEEYLDVKMDELLVLIKKANVLFVSTLGCYVWEAIDSYKSGKRSARLPLRFSHFSLYEDRS